jgi:hypothetical protein
MVLVLVRVPDSGVGCVSRIVAQALQATALHSLFEDYPTVTEALAAQR